MPLPPFTDDYTRSSHNHNRHDNHNPDDDTMTSSILGLPLTLSRDVVFQWMSDQTDDRAAAPLIIIVIMPLSCRWSSFGWRFGRFGFRTVISVVAIIIHIIVFIIIINRQGNEPPRTPPTPTPLCDLSMAQVQYLVEDR